jgi:hypothetical protein
MNRLIALTVIPEYNLSINPLFSVTLKKQWPFVVEGTRIRTPDLGEKRNLAVSQLIQQVKAEVCTSKIKMPG